MRKTCSSAKTPSTVLLSSWASSSVVPNGFSMTIRTSASSISSIPCSPSCSTITGKNSGAVER